MNHRHRVWLHRNRKLILLVYVLVVITVGALLQILQSTGVWP